MTTATTNRADTIRLTIGHLLDRRPLQDGDLTLLADHFGVSRERVRQLKEEVVKRRLGVSRHRQPMVGVVR